MPPKTTSKINTDSLPLGELRVVDPSTLKLTKNIRVDTSLDPEFVASIRERGVLVPITCRVDEWDELVVLRGHRRTIGAIQAGRAQVHVHVVHQADDDTARIIEQVIENDRRAGLSTHERVGAYEQLAALGLSAAAIAKQTATPKADVAAALVVSRAAHARAVVEARPNLTLDEATVLAELGDRDEDLKRLTDALDRGHGVSHLAQQLRDRRDEEAARKAVENALEAAGVRVITDDETPAERLEDLAHDGQVLTAEIHATCPGHAAWVVEEWVVDDEKGRYEWTPVYGCINPREHGHTWVDGRLIADRDEQAAAEEAAAADRRAQADKLNREIADGNKAWDAATKVRRQWLRAFAGRRAAPKTAAAFIAAALVRGSWQLCDEIRRGHPFAAQTLLGLPADTHRPGGNYGSNDAIAGLLDNATDGRAQMISLVLIIGSFEAHTGHATWQSSDTTGPITRYLRYLESEGYELSDVELRACGAKPKKTTAKKTAKA